MVSEDANENTAACSNWMGKVSVLLVELKFQELLYRPWLRWHKPNTTRQFNVSFSLKCYLCRKPLLDPLVGSDFKFEPSSHQ